MERSTPVRFTLRALLAGSLLGAWTAPGEAQEGNYNDIIVGSRAAGMGGAFTAIADDSSATFHNPAGLTQISEQGLSLSVSAYGFQRSKIDDLIASSDESVDITLDSLLIYPSASAYVLPLQKADQTHVLALSLVVPDFFEFEGVENLTLTSAGLESDVFLSRSQQTLMAGPSYAFGNDRFSIGASVFIQYATFNSKAHTATSLGATQPDAEVGFRVLDFEFSRGSFFGISGNLGVRYQPIDGLFFGATFQLPNWRLGGSAETYVAEAGSLVSLDGSGSLLDASLYQDVFREVQGDTEVKTPAFLSLGAAYTIDGKHTLAADFDVYFAIDEYNFIQDPDIPPVRRGPAELPGLEEIRGFDGTVSDPGRTTVINGSLGADLWLTPEYSLLLGLFSDVSAIPNAAIDEVQQVDMWGGSFGVTKRSEGSELTAGITGRFGSGRFGGLEFRDNDFQDVAVDVRQWSLSLFVGGTATLFEDEEKKACVEACKAAEGQGDEPSAPASGPPAPPETAAQEGA